MERLYVHNLVHSLKLALVYGARRLSNGLIMLFSFNGSIVQTREF